MLTIGLSGATCSGKTSVASMLKKVLPHCMVINQDTYYYEESSDNHVKDPVTNMINWEVLESFNMEKMHNDITDIRTDFKDKAREEVKQVDQLGILKNMLGEKKVAETILRKVEMLRMTPILIIEGIIVLNDPKIRQLCDLKFFIQIEKSVCWNRRKSRVWDPEGSCWEESPGYFENIAWPEYEKCLAELKSLNDHHIKFLDSNRTSIEDNFVNVLEAIAEKLNSS